MKAEMALIWYLITDCEPYCMIKPKPFGMQEQDTDYMWVIRLSLRYAAGVGKTYAMLNDAKEEKIITR